MGTLMLLVLLVAGVAARSQFGLDPDTLFSQRPSNAGEHFVVKVTPQPMLFDSGLQSWMDQQMGMIDALQSLFAPRSPCGGHGSPSFSRQDPVIAYMASSRFGPAAVLTTFLQQVDFQEPIFEEGEEEPMDWDADAEGAGQSVWSSVFESEGGELEQEQEQDLPDWLDTKVDSEEAEQQEEGRQLFAPGQLFASSGQMGPLEELTEEEDLPGPHKHHKHHKGHHMASCFDLITFGALSIGVIIVWGCLLRTAIRCSRLIRKSKKAARAAAVTQNPLLTPLVREDSITEVPEVAVASSEAPAGSFYVPQGSHFIRVAYQPLSSE